MAKKQVKNRSIKDARKASILERLKFDFSSSSSSGEDLAPHKSGASPVPSSAWTTTAPCSPSPTFGNRFTAFEEDDKVHDPVVPFKLEVVDTVIGRTTSGNYSDKSTSASSGTFQFSQNDKKMKRAEKKLEEYKSKEEKRIAKAVEETRKNINRDTNSKLEAERLKHNPTIKDIQLERLKLKERELVSKKELELKLLAEAKDAELARVKDQLKSLENEKKEQLRSLEDEVKKRDQSRKKIESELEKLKKEVEVVDDKLSN